MKNVFSEYYEISEQTYKEIWDKALFVFDTNLLLNLYRYTTDTRDNILDVMKKVSDRIWIPYQVGWEYFNNRLKVIDEVSNGYDAIKKLISNYKNDFEKNLNNNFKHHPYIDRDVLKEHYSNDIIKPINDILDEWKRHDPQYWENDAILQELTNLFDGKVGEDFSSASNPQPIGFSGILLAKRQNSFYCTYFLHNRNVADTKFPYPIKRLEVIRWFNQKSMVFNQSLS